MSRLKDKVALITGGTSGIGLVTARRFIEEGARVAITGTNAGRLEEARKILGADVLIIASDAGDAAAQSDIAGRIGETFGKLDALFLNAGIADLRPLGDWTEAAFDRSIDVDLKGPYFLVKALVPLFSNPSSIILSGLGQRAYGNGRNACLFAGQGRHDFAGADAVGRTYRAGRSRQCDQPGPDRHTAQ